MDERGQLLRRLLGPIGDDPGCERGEGVLDQFVDEELAGRPAAARFPDVAVHLEACSDCREDYEGLLALARSTGTDG